MLLPSIKESDACRPSVLASPTQTLVAAVHAYSNPLELLHTQQSKQIKPTFIHAAGRSNFEIHRAAPTSCRRWASLMPGTAPLPRAPPAGRLYKPKPPSSSSYRTATRGNPPPPLLNGEDRCPPSLSISLQIFGRCSCLTPPRSPLRRSPPHSSSERRLHATSPTDRNVAASRPVR
jgi:hypothetical protein